MCAKHAPSRDHAGEGRQSLCSGAESAPHLLPPTIGKVPHPKRSYTRQYTRPTWHVPAWCLTVRLPRSAVRDQFVRDVQTDGEHTFLEVLQHLLEEANGCPIRAFTLSQKAGGRVTYQRWKKWLRLLKDKRMLVKRRGPGFILGHIDE